MAKQRTNKTAKKRIHISNPRGNRKATFMYKQSHQGHLKTKRSSRAKRRESSHAKMTKTTANNMLKKIVNIQLDRIT